MCCSRRALTVSCGRRFRIQPRSSSLSTSPFRRRLQAPRRFASSASSSSSSSSQQQPPQQRPPIPLSSSLSTSPFRRLQPPRRFASSSSSQQQPPQQRPPIPLPPPTYQQLRLVAFRASIPMIGFGIMDNFVMITAGEAIDSTFGVMFGLSTMAAAGTLLL